MSVAFHHLLGDVPRDRHDGLVACLPLGQLRDCGVPQVVEAALEAGLLESIAPRGTPSLVGRVGSTFLFSHHRKTKCLGSADGRRPAQRTRASEHGAVQRDKAASAGVSLGLTDHKLTPHEVDLLPAQELDFLRVHRGVQFQYRRRVAGGVRFRSGRE